MLVDKVALSKHYDGDQEIQKELIELFNDTYPKNISELEIALSAKDYKNIHLHAHTLKGMIANFFAPELINNALILENCGKEENLENAKVNFNHLKSKMPQLVQEVRELS